MSVYEGTSFCPIVIDDGDDDDDEVQLLLNPPSTASSAKARASPRIDSHEMGSKRKRESVASELPSAMSQLPEPDPPPEQVPKRRKQSPSRASMRPRSSTKSSLPPPPADFPLPPCQQIDVAYPQQPDLDAQTTNDPTFHNHLPSPQDFYPYSNLPFDSSGSSFPSIPLPGGFLPPLPNLSYAEMQAALEQPHVQEAMVQGFQMALQAMNAAGMSGPAQAQALAEGMQYPFDGLQSMPFEENDEGAGPSTFNAHIPRPLLPKSAAAASAAKVKRHTLGKIGIPTPPGSPKAVFQPQPIKITPPCAYGWNERGSRRVALYIPNPARTLILEALPRKHRNPDFVRWWARHAVHATLSGGALPEYPQQDPDAPAVELLHVELNDKGRALVEFASREAAEQVFESPRMMGKDGLSGVRVRWWNAAGSQGVSPKLVPRKGAKSATATSASVGAYTTTTEPYQGPTTVNAIPLGPKGKGREPVYVPEILRPPPPHVAKVSERPREEELEEGEIDEPPPPPLPPPYSPPPPPPPRANVRPPAEKGAAEKKGKQKKQMSAAKKAKKEAYIARRRQYLQDKIARQEAEARAEGGAPHAGFEPGSASVMPHAMPVFQEDGGEEDMDIDSVSSGDSIASSRPGSPVAGASWSRPASPEPEQRRMDVDVEPELLYPPDSPPEPFFVHPNAREHVEEIRKLQAAAAYRDDVERKHGGDVPPGLSSPAVVEVERKSKEEDLRRLVLESKRARLARAQASSVLDEEMKAYLLDSVQPASVSPAETNTSSSGADALDLLAASFISETIETVRNADRLKMDSEGSVPPPASASVSPVVPAAKAAKAQSAAPSALPPRLETTIPVSRTGTPLSRATSDARAELAAKHRQLEQHIAETKQLMARLATVRTKEEKEAVLALLRERSKLLEPSNGKPKPPQQQRKNSVVPPRKMTWPHSAEGAGVIIVSDDEDD